MNIRKSTTADLEVMQAIYATARAFMAESGNPGQWNNGYPKTSLLEEDIKNGYSYVCVEGEEIIGTFFYGEIVEPTYQKIYEGAWLPTKSYGVVHRIAVKAGKKGCATFCLNWCYDQSGSIRIDTHRDNIPMQNLLNKLGFLRCGIIYLENGDERIAFQK
ncbi:MAG: hypothetical protein PWP24_1650 [Clostridiales bacterium]|nr:hypothetical protein [Clostridiales bacterium]